MTVSRRLRTFRRPRMGARHMLVSWRRSWRSSRWSSSMLSLLLPLLLSVTACETRSPLSDSQVKPASTLSPPVTLGPQHTKSALPRVTELLQDFEPLDRDASEWQAKLRKLEMASPLK